MIGIRRKTDDEAKHDDPAYTNKPVLIGFRNAYVFDVAQTDGAELPEMERAYGNSSPPSRNRRLPLASKRIGARAGTSQPLRFLPLPLPAAPAPLAGCAAGRRSPFPAPIPLLLPAAREASLS
jgi:hypothetical protein